MIGIEFGSRRMGINGTFAGIDRETESYLRCRAIGIDSSPNHGISHSDADFSSRPTVILKRILISKHTHNLD
jgi:hypothetical protein